MFKMAPNSLFAILLRSPWWISLAIALLFGLASKAALPADYWVFGAMGGTPFFVIAIMALRRQWNAPSAKRVEAILTAVGTMGWRDFAAQLEQAWTRDGYAVQRIEGAADFALTKDGKTTLVSAKRWKAAHQGEEGLNALHAAMVSRDASASQWIALGQLSANATRVAKSHQITLIQGPALAQLLRDWQP